ncbi:hypothetical protein JHK82_030987 [Glycine max]|nr:hypothetical protein JHK82_030987 [Glycine max]
MLSRSTLRCRFAPPFPKPLPPFPRPDILAQKSSVNNNKSHNLHRKFKHTTIKLNQRGLRVR